jgi:hypothetical protein
MTDLQGLIPNIDRSFDALERDDLERWTELLQGQIHAECVFHSAIGSNVGGGVYTGLEGIRGWFSDLLEITAERRWKNRRFETIGDDTLLFLADFEFTGAASGAGVKSETGAVAEYEDGQCVRMTSFMSHSEAREFAEAHAKA